MKEIFTPRRIMGIIILIILCVTSIMLSKPRLKNYNTYPEGHTEIDETYCVERENYVSDFIDKLADNKYEEAYDMLSDKAKAGDFNSIEVFSKYFKDHIIDNTKIKKEYDIKYKRGDNHGRNNNYVYNIVLYTKEDLRPLNLTFEDILRFYDGRVFDLTVVQYKPYDYKIYIARPDIPLTPAELEDYIAHCDN